MQDDTNKKGALLLKADILQKQINNQSAEEAIELQEEHRAYTAQAQYLENSLKAPQFVRLRPAEEERARSSYKVHSRDY